MIDDDDRWMTEDQWAPVTVKPIDWVLLGVLLTVSMYWLAKLI